jgi:hypothetical protein
MRRLLPAALLAAALASPAAAGPRACAVPEHDGTRAGACVDVQCLTLCVPQVSVEATCQVDHPVPMPVSAACALVERQDHVVTVP